MRTTVTLDNDLLAKATKMMGGIDRSTVLREGLKALWIDYFRDNLLELGERLRHHEVGMHPLVVGELACGDFSNREATLELLQQLRSVIVAEHDEIITFIRAQKLNGRGVGSVDVHLLAGAAIDQCRFWTLDKRLNAVAESIGDICLDVTCTMRHCRPPHDYASIRFAFGTETAD